MRRIFASPRLENVEAVQALLEGAGIATKVTNRETWRRGSKRDYSYTGDTRSAQWPTLWVLDMERYALARQMLKEREIAFESTRNDAVAAAPEGSGKSIANRIRIAVIIMAILAAAALLWDRLTA